MSLRERLRPRHPTDRAVLALAGPAFLALVSEPLFLLGDAAVDSGISRRRNTSRRFSIFTTSAPRSAR